MEKDDSRLGSSTRTVPVQEAARMTRNWRNFISKESQEFKIKGFLIPIEDIKEILQYNPNAEGIRTYLALENENDPSSAKLMIVPVVNGNDVIYRPASSNLTDVKESSVYDFTSPCPSVCGIDNELNTP